jgi:translation elongation factor EF-G
MTESHPPKRPVISVTLSPKFHDDWDKLQRALSLLTQQDQGLRTATQSTERQVTISGMGELHLEVICDRIAREFGVPLHVEKPAVIYLETIRKHAVAEGQYIRQVGGHGQYAHVEIELEPGEPESGYQFTDQSPEGTIPRQFVEPIDSGIQEAMKGGVLAGNDFVSFCEHATNTRERGNREARGAGAVLCNDPIPAETVRPTVAGAFLRPMGCRCRRRLHECPLRADIRHPKTERRQHYPP